MFETSPHFSAVAYKTDWMLPHENNLDNSLLELGNHELALLTNTMTDTTTTKWWEGCSQSWYFSHLQWFISIWQYFIFVSVLFIKRDLQLRFKLKGYECQFFYIPGGQFEMGLLMQNNLTKSPIQLNDFVIHFNMGGQKNRFQKSRQIYIYANKKYFVF